MTGAQQTQYYSFLEQQRKRAMYNQSLSYHYYALIRRYIAGGHDPRKNPELSAQYYALINEYGNELFVFETENGEKIYLIPENDSDVLN